MKFRIPFASAETLDHKGEPLERAFVDLEHGMNDVLDDEFMLTASDAVMDEDDVEAMDRLVADMVTREADAADVEMIMDEAIAAETEAGGEERVTAHARSRLAAFEVFEETRRAAKEDLTRIAEALNAVVTGHNMSRDFVNECHADIHRANTLEIRTADLTAANRKLAERVDLLDKQRMRYEALVEIQKRRDVKLSQELAGLREELDATRLDLVEANNQIVHAESQLGEMSATLTAKGGMADRLMGENETLRDKNVNLTLDLERSEKKLVEVRRKHEDLSAAHAAEIESQADLRDKITAAEGELVRLQNANDELESSLSDASERLTTIEQQMSERKKRYDAEKHALEGEVQSLSDRLKATTAEHLQAVNEIASIKTRLSNVDSEKHLAEKKFAALAAEVEAERLEREKEARNDERAVADLELIGAQKAEIEGLRSDIADLKAKLKQRQAGKVDTSAKRRSRDTGFSNTFGATIARSAGHKPVEKKAS
jgi:chromosome segregation ATPase